MRNSRDAVPTKLVQIVHVGDRRPRIDALDEQGLGFVHVADSSQVALIQQGQPDLPVGILPQPPDGLGGVPVRAEQVRAEMSHQLTFVGAAHQHDVVHAVAGRPPLGVAQQHAHHVLREPRWPPARRPDAPRSVHAQVRVQGEVRAGSNQDVFAARHHLTHRPAPQVRRRVRRHAQVAHRSALARRAPGGADGR